MFVHSLELGHTAGTRAIKAMGECDTYAKHILATSPHFCVVKCIIGYYEVETNFMVEEHLLFLYHESVHFYFSSFTCHHYMYF